MKARSENTLRLITVGSNPECYWVESTSIYISNSRQGSGWIVIPCFQLLGSPAVKARIMTFQADAPKWSSWVSKHGISYKIFGSKEELLARIEVTLNDHPL